ncbi:Uncharacterised protein [Bordetella pertussis]|nr:Uncharacterised protein [Bordetella pertussis]
MALRSSLSNPCARRLSDCSRVRPRAYCSAAIFSSPPSTGMTERKSWISTCMLWSTDRPTPCSRRSRSMNSGSSASAHSRRLAMRRSSIHLGTIQPSPKPRKTAHAT